MKKVMAILLALGAIGSFGLARRDSFTTQAHNAYGTPVGGVHTVQITDADRMGYRVIGFVCAIGCIYFVASIRRDDAGR